MQLLRACALGLSSGGAVGTREECPRREAHRREEGPEGVRMGTEEEEQGRRSGKEAEGRRG